MGGDSFCDRGDHGQAQHQFSRAHGMGVSSYQVRSRRAWIGITLGVRMLGLVFGLIAFQPVFAGEHDCESFSDRGDIHGRTGVVIPLDDNDHPVSPWKGARVVMGSDLKVPQDLLRFAGKPVVVIGAKFSDADFTGLTLADICFVDSDLSGSRWTGVNSIALAFQNVDLSRANLEDARLVAAQFQASRLEKVRAARANLSQASLSGGSLGGLDLYGANLTAFNLICGDQYQGSYCDAAATVDASGANLTNATLSAHDLSSWQFYGARIDGATIPLNAVYLFEKARLTSAVSVSGFNMAFLRDENVKVRLSEAEWLVLLAAWREGQGTSPADKVFREHTGRPIMKPKAGEEIIYADIQLPVTTAFRRTAIYRSLALAMFNSAYSTLYIKGIDRRHVYASGEAMNSKLDECDLEGRVYKLNQKTGWYGATAKDGAGWEDVFRLSNDNAEVAIGDGPFNSSRYVSCGDNAFSPMKIIPSSPELLKLERTVINAQ